MIWPKIFWTSFIFFGVNLLLIIMGIIGEKGEMDGELSNRYKKIDWFAVKGVRLGFVSMVVSAIGWIWFN